MKLNILHITPDFNYACGRSYYVFLLLKYFKLNKHNVYLITNEGDSFDRLQEHEIPFFIINSVNSKNPISISRSIKKIKDFIKINKINIIHTHHRVSELIGIQSARFHKNKKIKTVFTSLSLVNKKYNLEFRSDRIIAVSNTIKNMLTKKFGVKEDRIELISNFTDTEEINELELMTSEITDDRKYFNILSVGRFHHEKNFITLLKAMDFLKDPGIKLFLIGSGEKYSIYKNFISEHKLNAEIIPPSKNLLTYFLLANICVLPSIKDPFPTFMLQSGLHKKPFLGANVDGIAELIQNQVNGLLFEKGNYKDLAEKITFLKNNKNLSAEYAKNLNKDIVNNYTQEFIIPKIENLYYGILKN